MEARAFAAALLLFVASNRAGLASTRRPDGTDLVWLLVIATAAGSGFLVFGDIDAFLPCLVGLVVFNLLRVRIGVIDERSGVLERYRYVPVAAVLALTGNGWATVLTFALLAARPRNARILLIAAHRLGGPVALSSFDVDQIVPPPIRYDRESEDRGFTLVEAIVGMTLICVIASAIFTAAAGRAARLRQTRETAVTREAAVSELERVSAVPFEDLPLQENSEFQVPAGTGHTLITYPEDGIARIEVVAPRRGAAPVRLTTMRSGRVR